jgi:hypothetical protein
VAAHLVFRWAILARRLHWRRRLSIVLVALFRLSAWLACIRWSRALEASRWRWPLLGDETSVVRLSSHGVPGGPQ